MLPGKARCTICGRPITTAQANLHQTCDSWKCRDQHRSQRRALRKQRLQRERRQQEELKERVRRFRDEVARPLGIDQPESFAPVVVPANRTPLTSLPDGRRRAFRDHLMQVISEASQQPPGAPPGPQEVQASVAAADDDSQISPAMVSACAICEGHCCREGGDHAYQNVETIRRYLDEHPGRQPRDLLAAFLSPLSNRTYENSCICHAENGCSLPREMRSTACNTFECTALRLVQAEAPAGGPHRLFLAAVDGEQIVRFAFVHGDNHLVKASRVAPLHEESD